MEFCQNNKEFRVEILEKIIKEIVPNAKIRTVYRPTGANETYFADKREGSCQMYYLVINDHKNYLFPAPVTFERFEEKKGFNGSSTPGNLQKIIPAELVRNELRWEIKTPGQLI